MYSLSKTIFCSTNLPSFPLPIFQLCTIKQKKKTRVPNSNFALSVYILATPLFLLFLQTNYTPHTQTQFPNQLLRHFGAQNTHTHTQTYNLFCFTVSAKIQTGRSKFEFGRTVLLFLSYCAELEIRRRKKEKTQGVVKM